MRLSALIYRGLREDPQDAEARSHKYLVRASYIHRDAAGVYTYLPLAYRVIDKISEAIRRGFTSAGAQEILMPVLTPLELWQRSGRALLFGQSLPAFLTEGRSGRFVLGPTHEEVVTNLVAAYARSYKDLPLSVFQIQQKFRDEPRPRFGLIRTRELIMADAYSFDRSEGEMKRSYERMLQAYEEIFSSIGLEVEAVRASAGAIGGGENHEFMVKSAVGEDRYLSCKGCGLKANVEAVVLSGQAKPRYPQSSPQLKKVRTPGLISVKDVASFLSKEDPRIDEKALIKAMAAKGPQDEPTLFLIRGDRELKLPEGYRLFHDRDFEKTGLIKGYVGPVGLEGASVKIQADVSLLSVPSTGFVVGANEEDHHFVGALPGRDFQPELYRVLSEPESGDPCPYCGGELEVVRAVEVGHTFQLGLTYSEKLQAGFTDEKGRFRPYHMGCYGIGVSRLLAVVAEEYADEKGMCFPEPIAPFLVEVIALSSREDVLEEGQRIYEGLRKEGVEVLFDDRGVSPGEALSDAELIGVPWLVVVGPRALERGNVELRPRNEEAIKRAREAMGISYKEPVSEIPVSQAVMTVRSILLNF